MLGLLPIKFSIQQYISVLNAVKYCYYLIIFCECNFGMNWLIGSCQAWITLEKRFNAKDRKKAICLKDFFKTKKI